METEVTILRGDVGLEVAQAEPSPGDTGVNRAPF